MKVTGRLCSFSLISGPTAGGKTAVGVELALALNRAGFGPAEVVTADAFQVYRGMDIGTAKPTTPEQRGIPHHLIDLVEPTDRFTVHDWLAHAEARVADVRARGGTPVVVGGTNLYVKAFLDGLFQAPPTAPEVLAGVRAMPQPERRAELARVDPDAARRIDPRDERRTSRALEVFRQTGVPISRLQSQWNSARPARPDAVLVGLEWSVEAINARINARVAGMFERGLFEEASDLWHAGRLGPQAREALGYKQLIPHFEGRPDRAAAAERVKIETRRLAKKQRTWLRQLRARPGGLWIEAEGKNPVDIAQIVIRKVFTTPQEGC